MWIFNSEETALGEALEGMISAEPETYRRLDTKYGYGMFRRDLPPDRVRIIVDGGGGYGPMWAGFARPGLADAAVHGEFNSAPNAYVLYEMAKAVDVFVQSLYGGLPEQRHGAGTAGARGNPCKSLLYHR